MCPKGLLHSRTATRAALLAAQASPPQSQASRWSPRLSGFCGRDGLTSATHAGGPGREEQTEVPASVRSNQALTSTRKQYAGFVGVAQSCVGSAPLAGGQEAHDI